MSAAAGPLSSRLGEVLRCTAPSAPSEIRPEHRLVEDLGFDSIALVKTVVALEEAFGVELPPERLHELRSARVLDVAALLSAAGGGE
jgi:acyl carrier protein